MNDKMRSALAVALSPFAAELEESKLAAITFFELARKEGMVLDDFLSLKSQAQAKPVKTAPEFDWRKQATWFNYPVGHPQRTDHQNKFRNSQGQKTRQGALTADIGMEEMCQHYFHFGKYLGWYMVEVPSSYIEWLLENAGNTSPRAKLVYEAVLDARDTGDMPEIPETFDGEIEWCPLADEPSPDR